MTLEDTLREYSAPAELCEKLADGRVRCLACAHKCVIQPGSAGVCKVRFNDGGGLKVPWGTFRLQPGPYEKNLFHALPAL